jgi:N-methylhydantoinase A
MSRPNVRPLRRCEDWRFRSFPPPCGARNVGSVGFLIGVDIGGTFTDCAVVDDAGAVTVGKAQTTPDDPSGGFFEAIDVAAGELGLGREELLAHTDRLAHGTTVAINAVVTRSGARVGLLATRGFGDTLRIMDNAGRGIGLPVDELLHFPASRAPEPFVDPRDVVEITERVDATGEVVVSLDEGQVRDAAARLLADGVEAIAVCFLWSVMNPEHERRAAEIVRETFPDAEVSLSHVVAPKVGEYPRMLTTVLNAYVAPRMTAYTRRIEEEAARSGYEHGVLFMQSHGGLARGERIRQLPVSTLQSGPVGGVIGTSEFGAVIERPDSITTDVGGTTLDVSVVVGGKPLVTNEVVLERHQAFLDVVDVQSIGAGGGSIAWIDEDAGTLRVGPHSAGADPGPLCYGRGGTEPTVTDADLVLGVLNPDRFLGGRLPLDVEAARAGIARLAEPLGLSVDECAAGIVRIADERMSDLMRSMTVRRGLDPRSFTVYAFGGGGGAHAGIYTAGLGVGEFVVPLADTASVWSALGIAVADMAATFEQPLFLRPPYDIGRIAALIEDLEGRARDATEADRRYADDITLQRMASLKYGMQVFEVDAEMPPGRVTEESVAELVADFERRYNERFGAGAGYGEAGIVITGFRVRAHGRVRKPNVVERASSGNGSAGRQSERDVYWEELGERVATAVWDGTRLGPGAQLEGPAIVELPDTTIAVRPGSSASIDAYGNAVVRRA